MFTHSKTPQRRPTKRQSALAVNSPQTNTTTKSSGTLLNIDQVPSSNLSLDTSTTSISELERSQTSTTTTNTTTNLSSTSYPNINALLHTAKKPKYVFHQSERHIAEYYDAVPTEAKDALTSIADFSECSAKVDNQGHCWIVTSNAVVFLWKLKQQGGICHQLELPTSALRFHSCLVTTVYNRGTTSLRRTTHGSLGLLAVSQEGFVRYWPNVENKNMTVDASLNLDRQYAVQLVPAEPVGFVVGTSTGSLFHIVINSSNQLQIHQLQSTGGGMLYGFGLGSLLWGKKNIGSVIAIFGTPTLEGDRCEVFVMTQNNLQKWMLASSEREKLLFDFELLNAVAGELSKDPSAMFLLDMQRASDNRKLYILVMTVGSDNIARYFIVEVRDIDSTSPRISNQCLLQMQCEPSYEPSYCWQARLVIPAGGPAAYVAWSNIVLVTKVPVDERPLDCFGIGSAPKGFSGTSYHNDFFIGLGSVGNKAIFVANRSGILAVSQLALAAPESEEVTMTIDTSKVSLDSLSEASERKEYLLRAFKLYQSAGKQGCMGLVAPLIQAANSNATITESIDSTLLSLSSQILDAKPNADQRWAQDEAEGNAQITTLLVKHQLEQKKQRHKTFMSFLTETSLASKMSAATTTEITKHVQKLNAALALREYQNRFSELQQQSGKPASRSLLNSAIEKVLTVRKLQVKGSGLSAQDLFYSEISHIEDILLQIQEVLSESFAARNHTKDSSSLFRNDLVETNTVFETIVTNFTPKTINSALTSYDAAQATPMLVRQVIERQLDIIRSAIEELQALVSSPAAISFINKLFTQLFMLTDLTINAYKDEWDSARFARADVDSQNKLQQRFETRRTELIAPFLTDSQQQQHNYAVQLAERYKDFSALVRLFRNDTKSLHIYMAKYRAEKFSNFVFQMLMDTGRYQELFEQPAEYNSDLSEFLADHPQLMWIQSLNIGNYGQAATILNSLGVGEQISLSRRKTLLSLSKLSCLASGDNKDTLLKDNQLLHNVAIQEVIPLLSVSPSRILSPQEMIHKLLREGTEGERDILTALEIFVNSTSIMDTDLSELLLSIWYATFERNPWATLVVDWENGLVDDQGIERAIQQSIFYLTATNPAVQNLITPTMMDTIRRTYEQQYPDNPTLSRFLQTVFDLIKEKTTK